MRHPCSAYFASLVVLASFFAACDGTETASTTTTATTDGAGGSGGSGGEGGGFTCAAPFVTKGPWVLGVDDGHALVRWEACDDAANPDVHFMEEAGGAEQIVTSISVPITLETTYTAPLNKNAPPDAAGTYYTHEAQLEGLEQGTCYAYFLAADPDRKGRFCTSRAPGEDFTFLAIGDTSTSLGHTEGILSATLAEEPELTIHGGDIQYYDSGLETWASWFPVMQPMFSRGAFFPAIGNHESEKSDELSEYALRFFGGAGFDGGETFYRFQTGGVHFFSLNTEEDIGQGSAQATWLEANLVDAAAQPGFRFSVVYFHRPILTCGDKGDDLSAQAFLEPIFLANGVTLVLQAHMHGYERFELANGLTYMTTGGGGGILGDIDENEGRPYCVDRVAKARAFHAVVFDVGAATLTGTAIDERGAVIDTYVKAVP